MLHGPVTQTTDTNVATSGMKAGGVLMCFELGRLVINCIPYHPHLLGLYGDVMKMY
jgi:hypothetical protein